MSLKSLLTCVLLPLTLLLTLGVSAYAAPPTLAPAGELPTSVVPGHNYTFHLTYTQIEGDPPATLQMVVDTPYGQAVQKAQKPQGNPAAGEDISWDFSPQQSGQYQYHFEVTSATGGVARYPAGSGELTFESPSPYVKWIVLAVGLVVALFFLPIGILAFCGLAWYLFLQNEETRMIGIAIEAIAIGAFLVIILNRRRAA